MALNSLSPAFVVIAYHSAYGAHKMTIPTLAYEIGLGVNGFGGYTAWNGITVVEADEMVLDLCAELADFLTTTSEFDTATVYTKADANAPSIPRMVIPVNVPGVGVTTGPQKATQCTWNFKSAGFKPFKLVLLDCIVNGTFDKIYPIDYAANDLDVVNQVTDVAKAWSSRDNTIPTQSVSKTFTMNEKLRREYGMG